LLPAASLWNAAGPISKRREDPVVVQVVEMKVLNSEKLVCTGILKRRNISASLPYDLVPLGQIRNFSPVARRLNATIISGERTSASDISDE
jgi:hypothetical protein